MPPIAKRSGTRLGHVSTAEANGDHITKAPAKPVTRIPAADREWHPMAQKLYNSLRTSGQHIFMQDSDWAMAFFMADQTSYYLRTEGPKGRSSMMLTALLDGWSRLLTTEGDRRRLKIELTVEEEPQSTPGQAAMEKYAALLQQPPKTA